MHARLYVSLVQDPDRFREPGDSLPTRILAMAQQNTGQAELLRVLEDHGWRIAHDATSNDTVTFRADREFATHVAAINAARIAGATDHIIDCDDEGLGGTLETSLPDAPIEVGQRYALTADVERFPHFIARKGATGTVTDTQPQLVALTLDEPLAGAEEWDNAVIFTDGDFPSPEAEFRAHTVRLLPDTQ